jgi:hypothetical protein
MPQWNLLFLQLIYANKNLKKNKGSNSLWTAHLNRISTVNLNNVIFIFQDHPTLILFSFPKMCSYIKFEICKVKCESYPQSQKSWTLTNHVSWFCNDVGVHRFILCTHDVRTVYLGDYNYSAFCNPHSLMCYGMKKLTHFPV